MEMVQSLRSRGAEDPMYRAMHAKLQEESRLFQAGVVSATAGADGDGDDDAGGSGGGGSGGGSGGADHTRENSAEILLRKNGPKAKDVERLMLQRHRKTNTSAKEEGRVTVAVQDSIHRRIASESERASAFAAVERLARVLGVEASQLTVEAR